MQRRPTAKLATNPVKRFNLLSTAKRLYDEISLNTPAMTTMGTDRRKENLAAFSRSKPKIIPPEIEAPDRDTPGNKASA